MLPTVGHTARGAAQAQAPENPATLRMAMDLAAGQLKGWQTAAATRTLLDAWPGDYQCPPAYKQLLGRCLAAHAASLGIAVSGPPGALSAVKAHRGFQRSGSLPALSGRMPLVSIILPSYQHAAFVVQAIDSVIAQTWRPLELIVIDDGSRDGSIDRIAARLQGLDLQHRFIARDNRGAQATIDEGIALAGGVYIGILNSDDAYLPGRVAAMVGTLRATGARWGFSNVGYLTGDGRRIRYGENPYVDTLMRNTDNLYLYESVSFGLLDHNPAVSTGNLFFEKALWAEIGGFRDLRYTHDWAFCLDAVLFAEPAYFDEPTYLYRLHGRNTISENRQRIGAETQRMLADWRGRWAAMRPLPNRVLEQALARARTPEFAVMQAGNGDRLPRRALLMRALELGLGAPGGPHA